MAISGDRLKRARETGFAGVPASGPPPVTEGVSDAIAGSTKKVGYNKGPVITCPQIYASFWGKLWQRDPVHQARAKRLAQFLTDLPHSTFMNVLSQYGVGGGANLAGSFFQSSFFFSRSWYDARPVPPPPGFTVLTDQSIRGTIQNLIDRGADPTQATQAASVQSC